MAAIKCISLAVFALFWLSGLASAQAFVKRIDLGAHVRPESISQGWHGNYYASIQGASSDTTTDDGEIVEVDIETGAVAAFVPASNGLINPRGLAFAGGFLVVTDTTRVWKVDECGHVSLLAQPSAYPFAPVFFNDAAPERGGRAVFVSEMGPGRALERDASGFLWPTDSTEAEAIPLGSRVYRIGLDGSVTDALTPTRKILIPNGLVASTVGHRQLLALDFFFGSVVRVDLEHDTASILASGPFRGADGIAQASDGTIFVTSFENGRVWRMNARGDDVIKLFDLERDLGTPGRQTLADLALDEPNGLLYVPDTANSSIIVLNAR